MAEDDLEVLLNELIPSVQKTLESQGGFLPLGAAMSNDGEVSFRFGVAGEGEEASTTECLEVLEEGLRKDAEAGGLRAAGICMDVRVLRVGEEEKRDAMRIHLEHVAGDVLDAFLPYHQTDSGDFEYGELFGSKSERTIFGDPVD